MTIEIQPPRPGMQGRELDQWLDRIYRALLAVVTDGGSVTVVDHNDLENNGGDNSHTSIASHINSDSAHGVGEVAGTNEAQTFINKVIVGADNSISGLRHGTEVDSPSSGVHGVTGEVVGTTDEQTITNKLIIESITATPDTFYIALGTETVIETVAAGCLIQLPPAGNNKGWKVAIDNNSIGETRVVPTGLDTIEGETSQNIPSNSCMVVRSNGIEWRFT